MDGCCSGKAETLNALARRSQRRVLVIVMVINAVLFAAELALGLVARSSAMVADSVDMLGDALVYALSLYALTRGERWQAGAALAKAGLILAFGVAIVIDTTFKIVEGSVPSSTVMVTMTAIALAGNLACLILFARFCALNVNMASTFECSRNDMIANAGVLIAGGLVAWLHSGWPDIVAGLIIAALFVRSAARVFRVAWPLWHRRPDMKWAS
ncbi:cation transporter [Frateuria sp. Soil773]|uniref:cation transporter n=1 Tax=Frateuria sp. Soil773 TaxID=1736407 RepID=UPI0006F5BE2E|nr:cation transporter [Frateuria sp. Soil773]KRE89478.1 cation transporter [Frateuria sp. Soil773]